MQLNVISQIKNRFGTAVSVSNSVDWLIVMVYQPILGYFKSRGYRITFIKRSSLFSKSSRWLHGVPWLSLFSLTIRPMISCFQPSSGLHLVSSQSWCMEFLARWTTLARPFVAVDEKCRLWVRLYFSSSVPLVFFVILGVKQIIDSLSFLYCSHILG